MSENEIVTYEKEGVIYHVLVPVGTSKNEYDQGLPLSYTPDDLLDVYPDAPLSFRSDLIRKIQSLGLISYEDYRQAGANEKVASAIRSKIRLDVALITSKARNR